MTIESPGAPDRMEEKVIGTIVVRWNSLVYHNKMDFAKSTREGSFRKGTKLDVVEKVGNWLKVKDPDNDKDRVWVWGGFLKNESELKIGRSVKFVKEKSKIDRQALGDTIGEDSDNYFDFAPSDEARISNYSKKYSDQNKKASLFADHNLLNRTFEHRLIDHEIFLDDLLNEKNKAMEALKSIVLPNKGFKPVFVDIGPGLANKDEVFAGGKGKPAVTLQEIADKFPKMETIALELPSEVDAFLGKNPDYKVDDDLRKQMMDHQNIHVVAGNGLDSLKDTLANSKNNPYPERKLPEINSNTALIVRSANSMDIFVQWDEVKPSFIKLANDYKENPIIYFFNREILVKPAGSIQWSIVGKTSNRGFNHKTRDLVDEGYAYKLNNKKIGKIYDKYVQKRKDEPARVGLSN